MGLFDSGKQAKLKVSGMTCGHCQARVQGALQAVAGVRRADVNLDAGEATVTYDPAQAGPEDLARAVHTAGYQADVIA